MDFYTSMAPYYDVLFPKDTETIEFLAAYMGQGGKPGARLLDVGCGTGTVLESLQGRYATAVGLDLDPALLALAAEKLSCKRSGDSLSAPARYRSDSIELALADMRDLSSLFTEKEFSAILCLGNTLPHLTDIAAIRAFFSSVGRILADEGVFIFQVINYDRILDGKVGGLPAISRGSVSFSRAYSEPDAAGRIVFSTELSDSSNGKSIQNSVSLFPIRSKSAREALADAGFRNIEFFGDFSGNAWSPDSFLTIGVCSR